MFGISNLLGKNAVADLERQSQDLAFSKDFALKFEDFSAEFMFLGDLAKDSSLYIM